MFSYFNNNNTTQTVSSLPNWFSDKKIKPKDNNDKPVLASNWFKQPRVNTATAIANAKHFDINLNQLCNFIKIDFVASFLEICIKSSTLTSNNSASFGMVLTSGQHTSLSHFDTALGAAMLAGLSSGLFKDKKDLLSKKEIDKVYQPQLDKNTVNDLIEGWKKAINSVLMFW